jgi:hypothetical protein
MYSKQSGGHPAQTNPPRLLLPCTFTVYHVYGVQYMAPMTT